jgi:hypothetical protein
LYPAEYKGSKTLWEMYQKTVKRVPNAKFLGTRNNDKEGRPYEWKTYREVYDLMDLFARGMNLFNVFISFQVKRLSV